MAHDLPLISCIIPTGSRVSLVEQAIKWFAGQRYPNRELIIMNGDDCGSLLPRLGMRTQMILTGMALAKINCVIKDVDPSWKTGKKLNEGIAISKGELIARFDDDDIYLPHYLDEMYNHWLCAEYPRENVLVTVDGFQNMFVREGNVRNAPEGYISGGSFFFHRTMWDETKFRNKSGDEDRFFREDIESKMHRVMRVSNPHFIYLRHGKNIWTNKGRRSITEIFKSRPITMDARKVLKQEDYQYYMEFQE